MSRPAKRMTQIYNMALQLNASVLVLLGVGLAATAVASWSYEPRSGQSTWAATYPSCGGQRQSPINLHNFTPSQPLIQTWTGYDSVATTMTLTNNGHSVMLRSTGVQPHVTLSNGKSFRLDSVHFHWGKPYEEGSEHTLCGVRYSLEMHAVHKRVSADGSAFAPVEIIVLTSLFQNPFTRNWEFSTCAVPNRNPTQADWGLNKFVHLVPLVEQFNATTSVPPFAWSELVHKFTQDYYWYEGSLTTPPCSEVVTFFINRQLRAVTHSQMTFFHLLRNEENLLMSGNFRELQARNERKVYFV